MTGWIKPEAVFDAASDLRKSIEFGHADRRYVPELHGGVVMANDARQTLMSAVASLIENVNSEMDIVARAITLGAIDVVEADGG